MNVEKYEALLCVLEEGSISSAATRLDYTPSGISRMIQSVEEELGFKVLERKKGGVSPIIDFIKIEDNIRELVHCAKRCRETADRIRGLDVGSITVATAYPIYYPLLTRSVSELHDTYPNIKIQLKS